MSFPRRAADERITLAPSDRPTRARLIVLAFLCSLSFVLYLDRICMSQAVVPIQEELHLSNGEMSLVLMAFTLAYGLFEVPTGHWGDRIGARAVLTRIALWWSVFTALTGACPNLAALLVVRFLFGAGEAGAYPNTARVVARWFPASERGRAQGLIIFAALLGGTASPVMAGHLIAAVGWRWAFLVFGLTGVLWAGAFWAWFHDEPAGHPAVNNAELQRIGSPGPAAGGRHHAAIPWRAVFSNPSIWLLGAITTCGAFNAYLYYSWFPKYLQAGRGVGNIEAGWLAGLVLGCGAAGTLSGGLAADLVVRRGSDLGRARRWLGGGAFLLAAGFLLLAVRSESPRVSAVLTGLSYASAASAQSNWWSCAIETSGRHVGALFGLMNAMGVIGAMASQYFFGAFADWRAGQGVTGRAQWDPAFYVVAGVLLTASLCWFFYDTRPVDAAGAGEQDLPPQPVADRHEAERTAEEGESHPVEEGIEDDGPR
jgi:MFS family permease